MIIKHNPTKRVLTTSKVEEVKFEEPIIEILPKEEENIKEDVFSEEINFNTEENEEIF